MSCAKLLDTQSEGKKRESEEKSRRTEEGRRYAGIKPPQLIDLFPFLEQVKEDIS